jgi:two-component system, LuxR family, response regulator FixJ
MSRLLGRAEYTELAGRNTLEIVLMSRSASDRITEATSKASLITIVDDDPAVRKSLERLMRAAGFRTEAFASAEDFVHEGDHEETACLVLDLRLPGMSGLELQRYLADVHDHVPIVFVSAHDELESKYQALQAGAVAFLGKPFSDQVLLDAVHSVVQ